MKLFAIVTALLLVIGGASTQAQAGYVMGFVDNGSNRGLTDLQGREILPAVYAQLAYLGHGVFVARKRSSDPADKYGADDKILINKKGVELKVKTPAGAKFESVLWFGELGEADSDHAAGKLSEDSLLVFSSGRELGLCDVNGNIILPAIYTQIGYPSEGLAVLQAHGEQSFFYDVRKRKATKISYSNLEPIVSQLVSDGLIAFRVKNITKPGCTWGYLDTSGKVAIEPKFSGASGFFNGQAFVTFLDDKDPQISHGAIINKSGDVISPSELGISEFHGDYAIAFTAAGKAGVVDRTFKFVIEPKYEYLLAQGAPFYSQHDACTSAFRRPLFYYALTSKDAPPVVLSLKGEVLFELPKACKFPGRTPFIESGLVVCNVSADDAPSRLMYFDLNGHERLPPFSNLIKSNSLSFRAVAPGILMKTVDCSNDAFDVNYWSQGRSYPISRLDMFNRFLKQHNLIGMHEDAVVRLLGLGSRSQPADYKGHLLSIDYWVVSGGCLPNYTELVKVSFKGERVDHWCFTQNGKESPPITSNVVLKGNTKWARIGEQKAEFWPETIGKSH